MSSPLTADPWETDLFDVASINAEVSDRIFAELQRVTRETDDTAKTPRASVTIALGTAGAGKTHLFARLRNRVGLAACFVHVRPLFATMPTPRLVLGQILDALGTRSTPNGLSQIDVLAGAALGRALGIGRRPNVAIDDLRDAPDRDARLAAAAESLERQVQGLHGPTLRHVLRMPFADGMERQARLRLLEGEELTDEEAASLGMRNEFPVKLPDAHVPRAISTLSRLASLGAPLVVAFDQLENLDPGGDASRVLAFGHLLAELYDTAPGMVVLLLSLDDLWRHRIAPALPEAVRARIGRETRALRNPTPEEKDALLAGWRERDPSLAGKPFPAPFSETSWNSWRAETSATPRILLEELDAWAAGERSDAPAPGVEGAAGIEGIEGVDGVAASAAGAAASDVDPAMAVDDALARHIAEAHDEIGRAGATHPVPAERLRAALHQLLLLAKASVTSAEGEMEFEHARKRRCVVMAQQSHHISLAAALKRALDNPAAVAIRETRVPLPESWTVCRKLQSQLAAAGRWRSLEVSEMAWVLGLHDLVAAGRSGDVVASGGKAVAPGEVEARCAVLAKEGPLLHSLVAPFARPARGGARATTTKKSATSRGDDAAPDAPVTSASMVVARLGVASVDRVLREVRRKQPDATRAGTLAALENDPNVEILGPSMVAWRARGR
jgi:hypothetical protein